MREFLIVFREVLEIVLILGILYTLLYKKNELARLRWVVLGAVAGLALSGLGGLALGGAEVWMEKNGFGTLMEAILLFVSAGLILYVVVWLGRLANPAAAIRQQLEQSISPRILFLLAMVAVLREGLEAALFLAAGPSKGETSIGGALAGGAVALVLGLLLFGFARKLPLAAIFRWSNLSLIILAAGMVAYGTHELEEYLEEAHGIEEPARAFVILPKQAATPALEASSWYTCSGDKCYHILHEKGTIGSFFKTFVGYNTDPSWPELGLWFATLLLGLWLWRRPATRA